MVEYILRTLYECKTVYCISLPLILTIALRGRCYNSNFKYEKTEAQKSYLVNNWQGQGFNAGLDSKVSDLEFCPTPREKEVSGEKQIIILDHQH